MSEGYLVVLKHAYCQSPQNPDYRGIDRMPPYPSEIDAEAAALDAYVFDAEYKSDEDGLIHSLARARKLLTMLGRSPRQYELIFVATDGKQDVDPGAVTLEFLGYDLASDAPFYSIVGDMPVDDYAEQFRRALNTNGLFQEPDKALWYLNEYLERWADNKAVRYHLWSIYLVV